jgi:hypothetical protein
MLTMLALRAMAGQHDLPDPMLTPGKAFPGVTANKVCEPGYSRSVRHVSETVRKQVFAAYGLAGNHVGYCEGREGCELDHLIPLDLGGSNDPGNLWPQSYDSKPWNAHLKDHLERTLHALVCSGKLSLSEAQQAMSSNWIDAFKRYVGSTFSAKASSTPPLLPTVPPR